SLDYFFFQAEDGIRDFHVTGVQTCALPISSPGGCGPAAPPVPASGFGPPPPPGGCAPAAPAPAPAWRPPARSRGPSPAPAARRIPRRRPAAAGPPAAPRQRG